VLDERVVLGPNRVRQAREDLEMRLDRVLMQPEYGIGLVSDRLHASGCLEIGPGIGELELGAPLLLHGVDIGMLGGERLIDHLCTDLMYHSIPPRSEFRSVLGTRRGSR